MSTSQLIINLRRTIHRLSWIGLLCLVVAALLSACDDDPTPLGTAQPSNTPTPLAISTPTPVSTLAPEPTATLTPEPTATLTPEPTATLTPEPTATPTLTAEELVAIEHLSKIIPWFGNPPDDFSSDAAEIITGIWIQDAELGDTIASLAWIGNGVTSRQIESLVALRSIARRDPKLARVAANYLWFSDGISKDEWATLAHLGYISNENPELARTVMALPWMADEITSDEQLLLTELRYAVQTYPELAETVVGAWIGESLSRDLNLYILRSLSKLYSQGGDFLGQLTSQPWFADGLSEEEAAVVVTLPGSEEPSLHRDLLNTHHTQTRTVSLPLAGDVNIWVIQPAPFPPGEDLLTIIEDTARVSEELLAAPFPTTDVILLIFGGRDYWIRGGYRWDYMMLDRDPFGEVDSVPHETAHYYFNRGPQWFVEGGAQFIEAYVNDQTGLKTLNDRKTELVQEYARCVDERGIENVRHHAYWLRNYLKILTHKCIEGFEGRIVWFLQNDQERPYVEAGDVRNHLGSAGRTVGAR